MRRLVPAAALATATFAAIPAAAPALSPPASGRAVSVVAARRLDARLLELTVRTPALASPTKVRVLLPAGYSSAARRRYPVVYLLHGAGGDETDWTSLGGVEQATAAMPLIVVMPDGGRGGWYANWFNGGRGGPPAWETWHTSQLIRLVDGRFRTVAARRGRAIAGLSMGGFGALSYAARHPDRFAAAASFSGGVDLNLRLQGLDAGRIAVEATAAQDGGRPGSVFGDFDTQHIRWRGHDPPDVAANLRGLELGLYTGNGQPGGPLGGPSGLDLIELGAHNMSVVVHRRLERLGIRHVWDDYGKGSHTWPYWARDLRQTPPWIMRRFAHPVPPPARVTYTSTEPAYEDFGWHVAIRRPNVEFSTLGRACRGGFSLSGSGTAVVTTPPAYRPGARLRLRVRHGRLVTSRHARADARGRLRLVLRLAPVNRRDAGAPWAPETGHRQTVRVAIAAAVSRR